MSPIVRQLPLKLINQGSPLLKGIANLYYITVNVSLEKSIFDRLRAITKTDGFMQ